MIPEQIAYFSILATFLGYFLYFKSIFAGKTKPNLVSWFLWMLGPFLGVFFQLKAGAGLSALPVFMAGFGPLLVILFSIAKKNAIWKIGKLDMVCGTFSLLALLVYVSTHNLITSILFAIASDALAAIPTVVKAWHYPETESSSVYGVGIISNCLGLLVIRNWVFSLYSFGVYFILINLIIIFSINRKKLFTYLRIFA